VSAPVASLGYLDRLKRKARAVKRDTYVLYLACRDPRTPWYAKVLPGGVVAYALNPIDLIPDFIPVLGYLDDLILIPLGIYFTLRLIPPPVLADARREADAWLAQQRSKPKSYWAAGAIVLVWLALAYWGWTVVRDRL
jgi:uncharacterized membrane protein YkvA (DUF1232 family)